MASCMECIHFNPCNMHSKIIVEKPTEGNDWGLHNKIENECKYFTPTADVVEVKHGEWVGGKFNDYSGEYEEQCSNCKKYSREYARPYCPNCGAKMDGGADDGNTLEK